MVEIREYLEAHVLADGLQAAAAQNPGIDVHAGSDGCTERWPKPKVFPFSGRLLTDGAMGTWFDEIEREKYLCSEEANITNPSLVAKVHRSYVREGAQLLRSNTFLANRDTLARLKEKNKAAFADVTLGDLVRAGYRIAVRTAEECSGKGKPVFAAADIGPVTEDGDSEEEEILAQYYELCDIFLDEGADLFVMETFPDEQYVLKMAEYIRQRRPDAFLIGQFSLTPTGYSRTGFHYKTILHNAVESGLLDAVGLNCGIGAAHMKKFFAAYLAEYGLPEKTLLTALPNRGYPQLVRGRAVYSDSVAYFGEKVAEIAALGVPIVGGCCGTTPEYIGEIHRRLFAGEASGKKERTAGKIIVAPGDAGEKKKEPEKIPNPFRDKLLSGKRAIAVELDPPFDADDEKLMKGARDLLFTRADVITIADSPLARARADSFLMAAKVKFCTGMDAMPHLACRDKNRIAIRSSLLGGYASGIRNFLPVTGDPVAREEREFTKSVFNFNSIRLMKFLQGMNREVFRDDPVFYGGALNQGGTNPEGIAERMRKKMEAGCSFFLTQPVYSKEGIERLAFLKERTGAKILIGIMPLVSRRNALFIKNEMPGIDVPDEVAARYKDGASREEYEEVALEISAEIMREGKDVGAGYYFMTPFNRVSLIKKILENAD